MAGLQTKARRGRKSILQAETDLAAVRRAVQSSRQKISLAEAEIEQELGKEFSQLTLRRFLKKGCRYKRIRRRLKHAPNADVYALKREVLQDLQALSEQEQIDRLCRLICCTATRAVFLCCRVSPTAGSSPRNRSRCLVLDNATVHVKAVKDRGQVWQERGLFVWFPPIVWFLPTYSPHLTLIKPQHRGGAVAQTEV